MNEYDNTIIIEDALTVSSGTESYSGMDYSSADLSIGNIDLSTITLVSTTGPNYTTTANPYIGAWGFHPVSPFETGFPDWEDFRLMCEEYPGLEKTFEHLKSFYNLCKDDWDCKKREGQ